MESVARILILAGVALLVIGLILYFVPLPSWLGRLPGDVRIERPGVRIYFPLATSILLSVVLSALLWLFSRTR